MNLTYYTLARTPQEAIENLDGDPCIPNYILTTSKAEITQKMNSMNKSDFADGLKLYALSVIVEEVK